MSGYLEVVYNENNRPLTDYPMKLVKYLFTKYKMQKGMKMLEVGCGRCEFLRNFQSLGLDVCGVDISNEVHSCFDKEKIIIADVEKERLPIPDETFDIVYSKSFLEHLYYPEKYLIEARRILKPGGILLTLVPDWEANYKIYFDDHTHRSPFTQIALEDLYKIYKFQNTEVVKFRQLPIVWKFPILNIFCSIIAPFVPNRSKIKLLRWSKEIMLIAYGTK